MARGMNMGILALLVVLFFVLGSIVSFFVYLGRRAATVSQAGQTEVHSSDKSLNLANAK